MIGVGSVVFLVQRPSGVITFLFTDIEESTLRWESDPDAYAYNAVGYIALGAEAQEPGAPNGPVSYWKFDEGSGTTAGNTVVGAPSGTHQGGVTISSNISAGRNASGTLQLFARASDNSSWTNWQVAANGGFNGWVPLGGPSSTKVWPRPIVTELRAAAPFYVAEDYHQEYFRNNPGQPYCQAVVAPKVAKFRKQFLDKLKA